MRAYLPDVNIWIALSDPAHAAHEQATEWLLGSHGAPLLLCPVTEAGFVRIAASPLVGKKSIADAMRMLQEIVALPNCESLPSKHSWLELIQPLTPRLHGYRQVTDALLLGLAIRHNAVLVTLDRSIQALAGEAYAANLLTLA
ncbi:MAG: TA system VapC family ribonuclease toxin [Terracidiphilus sp.]